MMAFQEDITRVTWSFYKYIMQSGIFLDYSQNIEISLKSV